MAYDIEDYIDALNTVTGLSVDQDQLLRVGERIFNLERVYNEANGIVEDTLPERFLTDPCQMKKTWARSTP